MKKFCVTLCCSLHLFIVHAGDERNEVQASLKSVTVYRSGAEMVHNASANLKAGINEVIVDNVSNSIDSNSIQIKAPSSVTILGFEFSSNYIVNATKSVHMQLLEDSLGHIQANVDKLDLLIAIQKNYSMY